MITFMWTVVWVLVVLNVVAWISVIVFEYSVDGANYQNEHLEIENATDESRMEDTSAIPKIRDCGSDNSNVYRPPFPVF